MITVYFDFVILVQTRKMVSFFELITKLTNERK